MVRLSVVVGIVERLVPDELWELFQRVVPEAPSRPHGGRRRHGDREVLAAIVFVATSGCPWQQLPTASFGPSGAMAHRRLPSGRRPECGPSFTAWSSTNSAPVASWTGPDAIESVNMRALKRGT
ncbi:isjp4 transposase [Streptomyces pristinaespiralis ATCC 25486]|uniref:Isjp4 transposase n=1 Tax=Streptomyces pristinaespiralis (strain ATCC 25486 / DSM 40338 / CBS 914.69 / JCM 4507 / KCC S-0507 / NBRC 13074 / NRRL 2958 / 5647) TaxID=457429 RepID=B5H709_STRE2|nr:isjp4 transposase [Streptomyces pristinaespiralis ATCC 25486]